MKICAGLGHPSHAGELIRAGADELFTGFVPGFWLEKYSYLAPPNRRETLLVPMQTGSEEELLNLRDEAEKAQVKLWLTFNAPFYLPGQYPYLTELLSSLAEEGLDHWIVSDPGLILHLRKEGIRGHIALGGEAGVFDADAARLFLPLGVERFIFPRKISFGGMEDTVRACPGKEFEAFILNENCAYSGTYCMGVHCDGTETVCRLEYKAAGADIKPAPPGRADADAFGAGGCGVCALPELLRIGVTHLKIVGRGAKTENTARDIRVLREALSPAGKAETPGVPCSGNCYYPVPG